MYEARPWLAHYGSVPARLDYPEGSAFGMLEADAKRYPGLKALEFMGRSTSKAALLERVVATSRALGSRRHEEGRPRPRLPA